MLSFEEIQFLRFMNDVGRLERMPRSRVGIARRLLKRGLVLRGFCWSNHHQCRRIQWRLSGPGIRMLDRQLFGHDCCCR